MSKQKFFIWRIAVSLIISGAVTLFTLEMARGGGEKSVVGYPVLWVSREVQQVSDAVRAYRAKHGHLPNSLDVVEVASNHTATMKASELYDGFGQPFRYIRNGDSFSIVSYGRDGTPGGTWLDADVSSDNPHPTQARLSLWQFVREPVFGGMVLWALICGAGVFFLAWTTIDLNEWQDRKFASVIVRVLLTIGGTAYIALCITMFHVPSGH